MTHDTIDIDYGQLGTPVADLPGLDEAVWTPELRQFASELSQHMRFQSRLVQLREALGLSQTAVGELVGEQQSEISRMEKGRIEPSADRQRRILARLTTLAQLRRLGPFQPLRAIEIARYFLIRQDREDQISNLKLQKLLYFAQGTFLSRFDRPLFSDPLLAWPHGPVAPAVWREFKDFKSEAITPPSNYDPATLDAVIREVLDEVYAAWGRYSAWTLREMTHAAGPWKDTAEKQEIDPEAIKAYFASDGGTPTTGVAI